MHKTKLTFAAAALCGGLLALAPMSGAFAAPIAPIGKAATENDSRSMVHYRYGITIAIIVTGIIMVIIVTVGGATVVGSAVGDTVNNSWSLWQPSLDHRDGCRARLPRSGGRCDVE